MKGLFKNGVFRVMLVFLTIGVALLIFATVHTVNVSRKLAEYTHIQAVVTDKVLVDNSGSDSVSTVASVVEFEVDGVKYRVKNRISSSSNSDRKGGMVEIAYNPDNPDNPNACLFVESEKTWLIMLLAFSGVFLFVSAAFTVMLVRDLKRQSRGRTL